MKRFLVIALLLLTRGGITSAQVRTGASAPPVITGDWIGGIDFGGSWQSIGMHFEGDVGRMAGTLDLPSQGRNGLPLQSVAVKGTHVTVTWVGNSGVATYEGDVSSDASVIRGTFQQGETRGRFMLTQVARVDPAVYADYVGSYRVSADRFIDIGTYDLLTFNDSKTGRTGSLYPRSRTAFFSGPSAEIPLPVDIEATFVRNRAGVVTGLQWREKNGRTLFAARLPHRQERVTFPSGNATITGTLISPVSTTPHPAIVKVDPGYATYPQYGFFPFYFVRQGIAMLSITDRTIDGKPARYDESSFEERARDALAAVALLKERKDVDARRIGLHGSSLSAWVAPLAATMSSDVAFIILRAGSALPVHENILYEVESDLRQDGFAEDAIARATALRRQLNTTILTNTGWEALKANLENAKDEPWFGYARVGWMRSRLTPPDSAALAGLRAPIAYDPIPILEKVRVPVLAFNGALDRAVNTKVSVPLMREALRKAGNDQVTIVVLPTASHSLLDAKTGFNAEYAHLSRHAAGYWDTMSAWLKKHVTLGAASGP